MIVWRMKIPTPGSTLAGCSCDVYIDIPDGEDTASLGQVGLLRDTADSLLEDGGDLGGRGLGLSVGSGLDVEGGGCGISGLRKTKTLTLAESAARVDS